MQTLMYLHAPGGDNANLGAGFRKMNKFGFENEIKLNLLIRGVTWTQEQKKQQP